MFNTPPGVNLGNCSTSSFIETGAQHVYLYFVDTASHSWTAPNKLLVTNMVSGLTASTWWPLLYPYDTGGGMFETTTLTIMSTCEAVNNTSPVNPCGLDFSACIGQPGWNPSDGAGIYYYLPADSTIHSTNGSGGEHCSNTIMSLQTATGNPSPNGNGPLDGQIEAMSHETAEYLTDPTGTGWRCSIGSQDTEIADLCEGGWGGGPWTGSASGQPYNVTIGGSHYALPTLWQPGTANGCYGQPPDLSRVANFGGCSLASGYQLAVTLGGWCTVPTCGDGQMDGWETDVDCGGACPNYQVTGPLAPPSSGTCANGKKCQYFTDCTSGNCSAGVCSP